MRNLPAGWSLKAPRLAPLAALLLAGSPAAGQAPAPTPPLVLIGSDAVTRSPLRWTLVEPAGVPFEVYGPVVIVRDPAPGTVYRFAVEVVAPTPPPAPSPSPQPGPHDPIPYVPPTPPAPAAFDGHLRAVLIYEIDEPSTAGLRISRVKDALKALNCDWKVRDSSTADALQFRDRLRRDGLMNASGTVTTPVVYLLGDDNVIHGTVKAPTKPDEVIVAVKAVRGVK